MNVHAVANLFLSLFQNATIDRKYLNMKEVNSSHVILQNDGLVKPASVVPAVSDQECSVECARSETCVYIDFNSETETCLLHESGRNTQIDSSPLANGTKRYIPFGGMIGNYCDPEFECVVENSECRLESVCACKAGYSYQHSNRACKKDCDTYGNTFQFFYGHYIEHRNVESSPETTAAQCAQRCIEAANYTCTSFETEPTKNTCFLQEVDPSDVPNAYIKSNASALYQRNCA